LGCAGERVHEVCPLLAEGSDAAVALFVSAAANAGVAIEAPEALATAAWIVTHLRGNPLAIELAAAQAPVLSLLQIVKALDRPLDVLTNPARDVEAPQHSLRDAVAWSHGLLPEPTQRVLSELRVFSAPFEPADALGCLQARHGNEDMPEALRRLGDLHLLQRDDSAAQTRLFLPAAVRQWLEDRTWDAGCEHDLRQAHAVHYGARMRQAAELLEAGSPEAAAHRWRELRLHLLDALRWWSERASACQFLRAVRDFAALALAAGATGDAVTMLQSGIERGQAGDREGQRLAAWCAWRIARVCASSPDRRRELSAIRCARRLAAACDDQALGDRALRQLAALRMRQGWLRAAVHHWQQLIVRHENVGDAASLGGDYAGLATVQMRQGKLRAALASAEQAFDRALAAGQAQPIGCAITVLAEAALRAGRIDRARQLIERSNALPDGAFSALRSIHMRLLDAFADHESLAFDAALGKLARLRAEGAEARHEWLCAFIDVCADGVLVEAGRGADARPLPAIDLNRMPAHFNVDELVSRATSARVRLLAQRGHSYRCAQAVRQLAAQLRRAPNPAWLSLAFEACAHAAIAAGDGALACHLLMQSKAWLLRATGVPSPRQRHSWAAIDAAARPAGAFARAPVTGVDELERAMLQLLGPRLTTSVPPPRRAYAGVAG
jgi:hypothetical protein